MLDNLETTEDKKSIGESLHKHELFTTSKKAWESMLKSIESAEKSIDIEQFILWNDESGQLFFEALKKKAKEGVKVRLLVDTVGSFAFYLSNIPRKLEKAGVAVEFFNPFVPWHPRNRSLWYFRDHRRILIVDEKEAFTGGICISKEMEEWRDTHMKIIGPVVESILKTFNQMWLIQQRPGERLEHRFRSKEDIFNDDDGFCYMNTAPIPGKRHLYKTLLKLIKLSKQEILITTPYFAPDAKLLRLLLQVARRGIKVKLLLPRRSNHPAVDYAFQSFVPEILNSSVEIYYYKKMIHAKTIVIDGEYSIIGSLNLDNISLRYNFEGSLVMKDKNISKDLIEIWNEDMKSSNLLTFQTHRSRPWKYKLYTFSIYPFRKLL
jgi:cardiolipin synthase A/B